MVHVGEPSDGGYTAVIEGFSDGLIGMRPGETKVITIPPEKGYGYGDPNLIETHSIIDTVNIRMEYPSSKFLYDFGKSPEIGLVVEHPTYHWPMVVENVLDGYAIVSNQPEKGATYYTGSWYVKILDMDSSADNGNGTIKVENLITPEDAYHIKGIGTPIMGDGQEKTFVLTDVDPQNGTYTIDYNDLTEGRTLIFMVELISIDVY